MVDADCRVVSWNLWWRFGAWADRQPLIDDEIAATGADVIAVQEAYRCGSDDQPKRLAAAAGLTHLRWSPYRDSLRWRERVSDAPGDLECGVAILSRWPFTRVVERHLPSGHGPSGSRTALGVVIEHPRGPLPMVTTHLDSHPARSPLRVEQLSTVTHLVHDLAEHSGPSALAPIVCGDMNAEPEADEIRRLCGLTRTYVDDVAFQDAWRVASPDAEPGWTWRKDNPHVPDGNPNARIDYVFVGMAGRVATVRLVGLGTPVHTPSDHAGVLADLRP